MRRAQIEIPDCVVSAVVQRWRMGVVPRVSSGQPLMRISGGIVGDYARIQGVGTFISRMRNGG